MEMILVVTLCIITGAFMERRYSTMQHMVRVRAETDERQKR